MSGFRSLPAAVVFHAEFEGTGRPFLIYVEWAVIYIYTRTRISKAGSILIVNTKRRLGRWFMSTSELSFLYVCILSPSLSWLVDIVLGEAFMTDDLDDSICILHSWWAILV